MFRSTLYPIALFIAMTTALLVAESPSAYAQQVFQAGAAQVDVTPQESVPMWGYGDRHAKLSEGTMDPLMATAVVIQAGKNKMAIVGLDIGRSPVEGADEDDLMRRSVTSQNSSKGS